MTLGDVDKVLTRLEQRKPLTRSEVELRSILRCRDLNRIEVLMDKNSDLYPLFYQLKDL